MIILCLYQNKNNDNDYCTTFSDQDVKFDNEELQTESLSFNMGAGEAQIKSLNS